MAGDQRQADDEYRRVTVSGHFLNDRETLVQAVTERGAGFWVLTPLVTRRTASRSSSTAASSRRAARPGLARRGQISGETTVTGLLRMTEPKGGVPAHERSRGRPLVFARRRRDRRRTRPRRSRALLHRCRRHAKSRRPAGRRPDGHRIPQQPSRLRADLVRAGADARRRLDPRRARRNSNSQDVPSVRRGRCEAQRVLVAVGATQDLATSHAEPH